ncbi:DUF5908 family protein [Aquimarina spongiae]|uniref:Uncharacterized protein n=1 Tax=Aquimarina spongiae TaxID=570521 RepID=A0A1M6IWK6_9FLAO|nr:DUF5908 family protein [Aquimarina spongiae]SHJ38754.1 hypothetical protein SAMN04488508_108105 [Aquimarina spongiae]
MPIEIKELHIKINVDESSKGQKSVATFGKEEKSALIASCVEQVMDILEMREER